MRLANRIAVDLDKSRAKFVTTFVLTKCRNPSEGYETLFSSIPLCEKTEEQESFQSFKAGFNSEEEDYSLLKNPKPSPIQLKVYERHKLLHCASSSPKATSNAVSRAAVSRPQMSASEQVENAEKLISAKLKRVEARVSSCYTQKPLTLSSD